MKFFQLLTLLVSAFTISACSTTQAPEDTNQNEAVITETVIENSEEVLTEAEEAAYEAERAVSVEAQAQRLEAATAESMTTLASGNFVGVAPGHNAEGSVTIKEDGDQVMIELGEDFNTDKGPDLYVILSQDQPLTGEDPVSLNKEKIKILEPLADRNGRQVYVASKADFENYGHSVVIWCNKYNVVFGGAVLQ